MITRTLAGGMLVLIAMAAAGAAETTEAEPEYALPAPGSISVPTGADPPETILFKFPGGANVLANCRSRVIQGRDCYHFDEPLQRIECRFTIREKTVARIWVNKISPHYWHNSFHWRLDDGDIVHSTSNQKDRNDWLLGINDVWYWSKLGVIELAAGEHKLTLQADANVRRHRVKRMAFGGLAIAFTDDLARETWLGDDLSAFMSKRSVQTRFGKDDASTVLQCIDFDRKSGPVLPAAAEKGKALFVTGDYEKSFEQIEALSDVEVQVWMRIRMEQKNLCQGMAIEEFMYSACLEIDGQLHGVQYAVSEKNWLWVQCPNKVLKKGLHVIGLFQKGPGVWFDRVVLYTGDAPRREPWFTTYYPQPIPFGYPNAVAPHTGVMVSNWVLLGEGAKDHALAWQPGAGSGEPYETVLTAAGEDPVVLFHQLGIGMHESQEYIRRRADQQFGMVARSDGGPADVLAIVEDKALENFEIPMGRVDGKWSYLAANLIEAAARRHEPADRDPAHDAQEPSGDGKIDFPVTLKYLVVRKATPVKTVLAFSQPEFRKPLLPRIRVDGPADFSVGAVSTSEHPTTCFLSYEVRATGDDNTEDAPLLEGGVTPALKVAPGGEAFFPVTLAQVKEPGLYRVSTSVNHAAQIHRYIAVGGADLSGFLKNRERECGAYRFSQDGKDQPLMHNGRPVTPEQTPQLYGKAFKVEADGLDVTSWEYCDKMGYGEDRIVPEFVDLSDECGWPERYVLPGVLAIDPRSGRFKFSEGDEDPVSYCGSEGTGFGVHGKGFTVQGDFISVCSGEGCTVVINMADPRKPHIASQIHNYYFHRLLIPYKNVGYMSTSHRGVIAVDNFANPYCPGPLRTLQLDMEWQNDRAQIVKVFEKQEIMYLSNGVILDIADPLVPRVIRRDAELRAHLRGRDAHFFEDSPLVYMDRQDGAMSVFDVSDPANYRPRGRASLLGRVDDVRENRMLTREGNTIHVYDISNRLQPKRVMSLRFQGEDEKPEDELTAVLVQPDRIVLKGSAIGDDGLVYIIDGQNRHGGVSAKFSFKPPRIYVVDTSPKKPELAYVHQEPGPCEFMFLKLVKNHLVIDDYSAGIRIFGLDDPRKPVDVARVLTAGEGRQGNYVSDRGYAVYANTFDGAVQVVDVRDQENPKKLGHVWDGGACRYWTRIQGKGDYIYAPKHDTQVIDISDPTRPKKIGRFDDGSGYGAVPVGFIAAKGNVAVIGGVRRILKVTARPRRARPDLKEHVVGPEEYRRLFKTRPRGNADYRLKTESAVMLQIYDTSNPAKPVFRGEVDCEGCTWPVISGAYVYAIQPRRSKAIKVDISDPANPVIVARLDLTDIFEGGSFGWGFTVSGDYLYSSDGGRGRPKYSLHIIDVSLPDRFVYTKRVDMESVTGPYAWADSYGDAQVHNGTLSLTHYGYITVYDVANPFASRLLPRRNMGCQWTAGVIRRGALHVTGLQGLLIVDLPNHPQRPVGKVVATSPVAGAQ